MKVNVKWGKELYADIEVDTNQPPWVFKTQLFTLSGVPPERQKVLIKGGQLKDDEWGKQQPKEGMTIMMMGSTDEVKIEAPVNAPRFVEDLPESEQNTLETKQYGSGLKNLGNTCYMNSTVQCLYSVEGLREALTKFQPASLADPNSKLVAATQELFTDLHKGKEAFAPFRFLITLRQRFPQFAQQTNEGLYMQQDAEECWTQVMFSLKEQLKDTDGTPMVDKLFGVRLHTKLKCDETGEEFEEDTTVYTLKCNINIETNYLTQGITLGLVEDREKNSDQLGQLVLFKGSAKVACLPPYLTVQMVRFFYKAEAQQKAKILRKVTFPLELDVYDFCTPQLQKQLAGPRALLQNYQDKLAFEKRTAKQLKKENGSKPAPAAAEPVAGPSSSNDDVELEEADAAGTSAKSVQAGAQTGRYELTGVLTHKGRSADSGHYVSWIKQHDGSWVLFDDDELHIKTAEDVLTLNGGGDWHMAYLLMYKAITVPEAALSKPAAA
eukprot:GHRR01001907.1.p1 GENE.GHRR01001907.1~~GHRR01001907.1.p1  ORF type:complete len:495 (+),score=192.81 GHRR01001907.1:202-1686(+)